MLELFINKKEDEKQILLTDDGKLVEYYNSKNIENRNEGNIFVGIVKDILVGMNAAFVDIGTEKNSYIQAKDIIPQLDEKKKENKEKKAEQDTIDIRKIIKPNQRILVQVRKDSNELKGARISTHITIPSKYIVFMPNTDIITISQKIQVMLQIHMQSIMHKTNYFELVNIVYIMQMNLPMLKALKISIA